MLEPLAINFACVVPVANKRLHYAIKRHDVVLPVVDIAKRAHLQFDVAVAIAKVDVFCGAFVVVHTEVKSAIF